MVPSAFVVAGRAAADAQRQGRPRGPARARRQRPGDGAARAAHAARARCCAALFAEVLGRGPGRHRRRLLRPRRPLAAGHPADQPDPRHACGSSCRSAACSRRRPWPALATHRRGRRRPAPILTFCCRSGRRGAHRRCSASIPAAASAGRTRLITSIPRTTRSTRCRHAASTARAAPPRFEEMAADYADHDPQGPAGGALQSARLVVWRSRGLRHCPRATGDAASRSALLALLDSYPYNRATSVPRTWGMRSRCAMPATTRSGRSSRTSWTPCATRGTCSRPSRTSGYGHPGRQQAQRHPYEGTSCRSASAATSCCSWPRRTMSRRRSSPGGPMSTAASMSIRSTVCTRK